MKTGDKVRMTKSCKNDLIESECENHANEFGDCIGIVEDLFYSKDKYEEWNVRWLPSMLRYAYSSDELITLKEIRKQKLDNIDKNVLE